MPCIRLPRFKRSCDVPSIRLTVRDREILHHVHKHRFLRSDHLTSLLPGSRHQTLWRPQLLYPHGYLERLRCQIDYYHRGGSRTIAYGLGNKGAGLLKRELSLPYHRLDWPKKNAVARLFLEHALLVSDVMVAIELVCRKRPVIRLLPAGAVTNLVITLLAGDTAPKLIGVSPLHDLSEKGLAEMHEGMVGKKNRKENGPENGL